MFAFYPAENIRKCFLMFSGGSKGNIGKKWVNMLDLMLFKHTKHTMLNVLNILNMPY